MMNHHCMLLPAITDYISQRAIVVTLHQSVGPLVALVSAGAKGKTVQYPSLGKSSKTNELQEICETRIEQLCKLANVQPEVLDEVLQSYLRQLSRSSKTLNQL